MSAKARLMPLYRNNLLPAAAALAFALGACTHGNLPPQAKGSKYHAGERWSYHTRDGEEASTIVICSVEPGGKQGNVVHICVEGLKVAGPDGRTMDHIGHMPMSPEAVDESVVRLIGEDAQPSSDYSAGYDLWKTAGSGGIFAIPVRQAVSYCEKVMQLTQKSEVSAGRAGPS